MRQKNNNVAIVAHRGKLGKTVTENTLKAFAQAIALGVDMIELDVRKTKDNVLVCYHDSTIDQQAINRLTYPQLLEKSQSQGFEIPTLEQAFDFCRGRVTLDIELKESGYEEDVIRLVKQYLIDGKYKITSFHHDCLLTIKKLDPKIVTGLLLTNKNKLPWWQQLLYLIVPIYPLIMILASQADFIAPHYSWLSWEFCWCMKLINKEIYVWTVNEEQMMIDLVDKGVFALITDYPDKAIALFS